jgi:hypothetical protein
MDSNEPIAVDFIFPPESGAIPETKVHAESTHHLSKCTGCGGGNYVLANEMGADVIKGIPASRMYECADCGTYRLG